jgi:beta-lactam-binding protein with PASTA domain
VILFKNLSHITYFSVRSFSTGIIYSFTSSTLSGIVIFTDSPNGMAVNHFSKDEIVITNWNASRRDSNLNFLNDNLRKFKILYVALVQYQFKLPETIV